MGRHILRGYYGRSFEEGPRAVWQPPKPAPKGRHILRGFRGRALEEAAAKCIPPPMMEVRSTHEAPAMLQQPLDIEEIEETLAQDEGLQVNQLN